MSCWITDGSSGFTVNGNVVTHIDDQGVDNVFNAMWQEGDGVSSGKHYWKIHFQTLEDGAGVGLTSKDHFKEGYACKAIKYLGNLSNSSGLLVGNFGPRPNVGDVIGILAVFEDDRLKVYIDVNEKSLGLAFNVPASTFKTIFPIVSFHKSGSATCAKQPETPNITGRASTTFTGIEGDWRLTNFQENGVILDLPCSPTSKIAKKETDKYSWHVKVVNGIRTSLSKEDGNWKTSGAFSTKMLGPPESMKVEHSVNRLISEVKIIEIDGSGNLSVKSDKVSTTWVRYDSAPGPYVGEPFA